MRGRDLAGQRGRVPVDLERLVGEPVLVEYEREGTECRGLDAVDLAVLGSARSPGTRTQTIRYVALAVIFALSLAFSVYLTAKNQPFAYFNTFARAWEFSIGALLAIASLLI